MGKFLVAVRRWLACLFGLHDWGPPQEPLPRGAWLETYRECQRCGTDTRPTWAIQDEMYIREERIYRKLHGPKDWSPRSRR